MRRHVTLSTDLSLDQARIRLRAAIDPPWAILGRRPVMGRVEAATAWLMQRRPMNNAFQTQISLVLEPQDERRGPGLVVHGTSAVSVGGRALLVAMVAMLAALPVVVGGEQGVASPWAWVVTALGALAVGLVYVIGRALAEGEHDFLIRFLVSTLDARVIAEPRQD